MDTDTDWTPAEVGDPEDDDVECRIARLMATPEYRMCELRRVWHQAGADLSDPLPAAAVAAYDYWALGRGNLYTALVIQLRAMDRRPVACQSRGMAPDAPMHPWHQNGPQTGS